MLNSSLLELNEIKYEKSFENTDSKNFTNLNNSTKDTLLVVIEEEVTRFRNFERFDHLNGLVKTDTKLVPNIIHYINLNQNEISFPQFLSILSSWLIQQPDHIYLHCNLCRYKGKYWRALNKHKEIKKILKIKFLANFDSRIFYQKAGWIHHKSDVLRIVVLMNYGIYH
jgi:hypothetical protein